MHRVRIPNRATSIAAALALMLSACSPGEAAQEPPLAGAEIGGEFTLMDSNNRPVSYSDFDGKYRIVYFGYTHCPDVCPLDLQKLMQGYRLFEKEEPQVAADIQPIFITIDPQRDTPAVVGEYTQAFSPRLVGLTGGEQQIADAAKAFAVYRMRGEDSPGGGYLMDHSRTAFLMDRNGEPMTMLPVDKTPQDIAAEIARWTS